MIWRPPVDKTLLVENRELIHRIDRRGFLRGAMSLGALVTLTGCDISNRASVRDNLRFVSQWNNRVQGWLFDPDRLAPTFDESLVMKPPRFNAYYPKEEVKPVDRTMWQLELSGLIQDRKTWTLEQIDRLPKVSQITRHVCVEGWDYIGKWTGVPLRAFLERVGADTGAKYVNFICADGYSSSLDMATALHPQTQLTTHYADELLADDFGFPLRLRAATKLGFKTPKWIRVIEVTNRYPGGYWEDRGYNWFSGL